MSVIHGVNYGTPTLDLNFAKNKSLIDTASGRNLVTFTRAQTAREATYVGADGLIKTAVANEARFDHNPATGESLGLLIEEQRTNNLLYSEQFDNAYWTKDKAAVISNAAIAPDGTLTADLLYTTASGSALVYTGVGAVSSAPYTTTIYLKSAGFTWAVVYAAQGNHYAFFNLANGTVGTQTAGITAASISPVGNGWYRCSVTQTATYLTLHVGPADANGSTASTASGTSGIYIWGAQVEAGAFPTSYIPTVASTVTRSADVASITGTNFSSWHNSQGIGTIVSLAKGIKTAKVGAIYSILSTNGSFSNMIEVEYDSRSSQLRIYKNFTSIIDAGTINNDTFAKTCMSYSPGSYAAVLNGSIIATSNSAGDFPTPLSLLHLGRGYADDGGRLNGIISRLTYYPTRLQDFQLQQLTK